MKYPITITPNSLGNDYVINVPDLPGCQTKAATIDEAMMNIVDAIAAHLTLLAEYGETIPQATSISQHVGRIPNQNIIWAVVDIDVSPYLGRSHKINVTLPELLIKQIDDRVSKLPGYKTRSGFIASACLHELAKIDKSKVT